jgi:hypothetical protein
VADKVVRWGALLAATLLFASCTGRDSSISSSPTSPTGTTSPSSGTSQTVSPTPSTTFTSSTYGYSLKLPAGWTSIQAQKAWDGKSVVSSAGADVDQLPGTYTASSWVVAAPSKQKLPAYVSALIAATTRYHGDTCPAKPATRTRVTIGGEPGMLLAYNCGILINLAAAVHHGVGYQVGFRDPSVKAATDPADHAAFLAILESVQFPD